jgi:hypothetical protein
VRLLDPHGVDIVIGVREVFQIGDGSFPALHLYKRHENEMEESG